MESQPPTDARTILLVDEQDKHRLTAKWLLGNFGFAVECARKAEDALSAFDAKIHALVITENLMNGMSGTELAHIIKLRSPSTPVIMCCAQLPEDRTCLDVVIQKPVPLLALKGLLDRFLKGQPDLDYPPIIASSPCACSRGSLWAES